MPDIELVLDCADADAQAEFWTAALGYTLLGGAEQYRSLVPPDGDAGPKILLQQVAEPKPGKNRMHLDMHVPDIEGEVSRLIALGARRTRDEQFHEFGHDWIAMADPEGNEFCVCSC